MALGQVFAIRTALGKALDCLGSGAWVKRNTYCVFELAAVSVVLRIRGESLVPFQRVCFVSSAILVRGVEQCILEALTLPGHGLCRLCVRTSDSRHSYDRTRGRCRSRVRDKRAGSAGDYDPLGGDDGGAGRRDGR